MRAGAIADRGEVYDHRHVLVAPASVAPHVLIDPDDPDALEAGRVGDQHPFAFGQHGVVRGVPCHAERVGDPGDGEMADHERFEGPRQRPFRQRRSRVGRPAGVLTPRRAAVLARVAADRDHQRRGPPAQRHVRQTAGNAVTHDRPAAAPPAPAVIGGGRDPARQQRLVRGDPLAGDHQPQGFQAAKGGQIGWDEAVSGSNVEHVEVFLVGCVRTPIIGRPRPRRADPRPAQPTLSSVKSPQILAYHATGGASNGPTEAVNLLIEKTRRIGHGFRNFNNYRLRLLLACGIKWQPVPVTRIRGRQPRLSA